jgi:DNA-binding HxlR family transcriptional regulator
MKNNEKKLTARYRKAEDCPITASINVIGGKWKPIILWVLLDEPKRFGELNRIISGIALKVLSHQLKELENAGLVHRQVFAEVPPRVEYSLTKKGESLRALLNELAGWSTKNILAPAK